MLKAGWGRVGRAAADGSRVAQAAAASNQRRQEPPMLEQRPPQATPTRRRRPAPLAPCGRYSQLIASLWRGAPARRTDCA